MIKARIDINANGKYRVLSRWSWWPFWFVVKDRDCMGDVIGPHLFESFVDACKFIQAENARLETERRERRWKKWCQS